MKREEQEGKNKNPRITDRKCSKCGHGRAWINRGNSFPSYRFKCARCGSVTR